MEYVEGASLDVLLKQHVRAGTWLPEEEILEILKQTLEAFVYAHSSGLYHRDIKPPNILVSKLGVVKIVDFGLARLMTQPSVRTPGGTGFAWTGTPEFMSPEQANGGDLDYQSDIFSVGLVAYLLLTKRHPFYHPSGLLSIFELIKDPSFEAVEISQPSVGRLPKGLAKVVMKMLKKDKELRCKSLMEPLSELTKEEALSCPHCGSVMPTANLFCGQCGKELGSESAATVSTTTTTAPPPAPVEATADELCDQGHALTQRDEWIAAIRKYEEALHIDPNHIRSSANLGYAKNRLGLYSEAIEILTRGISLTKDSVLLHRMFDYRGFAKSNLKDYDGAVEDFSRAIGVNSRNPRVFHHRAESHALAGRLDQALGDVLVALKLNPEYQPALRLRERLRSQGAG